MKLWVNAKDRFGVSPQFWATVRPWIPRRRNRHPCGGGRKPTDPRRVFAAIVFVWRTGCQWRALDVTGLCAGSTAHRWFQRWVQAKVFRRLWRAQVQRYEEVGGLDWSFVSVDGCMTKAPLGGEAVGPNPTDRGKIGTKVHVQTDAAGLPLAVVVTGANCNDHKVLGAVLAQAEQVRPAARRATHGLCLDKGYDYAITPELADFYGYRLHLRRRGEDRPQRRPRWKPRRWVVERTHGWFHRSSRRLLVRWEKKADNFLAFVHLSCAAIYLSALS